MAVEALHLVRIPIGNERAYWRFLRTINLPPRGDPHGYTAHALLSELFRDHPVKPFRWMRTNGKRYLLGYAQAPEDRLRAAAETHAARLAHTAVDWEGFAARPIPETLRGNFLCEIHATPVVRSRLIDTENTPPGEEPPLREVDVFVREVAARRPGASLDRHAIYLEWLTRQVARFPGVALRSAAVHRFRLVDVPRRRADRTFRLCRRPDVVFRGILQVEDPQDGLELLRRGVGRERAFGFGLVLLARTS